MLSLIALLVVGGLIFAVVAASRGREPSGTSDGAVSIRRLFQYVLLLAALIVAAVGLSGILERVIGGAAARRGSELAGSLALLSVGVPVFWALAVVLWRRLSDPKEQRSVAWALYVNTVLIGSLSTIIGFAFAVANEFIDGSGYDGGLMAPLIVSTAVWGLHWEGWRRQQPHRLPMAHVYVGAAIGLFLAAGGVWFLITTALDAVFTQAAARPDSAGDDLSYALVSLGIGAATWTWHWIVNAAQSHRDSGWYAYVLLIGIFGGLATAVGGAAGALFLVLQWLFGDPEAVTASAHFQDLAPAIAAAVVGGAVWFYHRTVLGLDRTRPRIEVDRLYDHLVAGIALATIATALTILWVALFETMAGTAAVRSGSDEINTVIGAITGLLVGVPIWLVAWTRAQRAVHTHRREEATSPTRRVYLFGVFGVGGAIAFGALIRLLVVIYEALFDEGTSRLSQDVRVPVALLITVGTIAAYHWYVYRAERLEPVRRRDVLLVWPAGAVLPEFPDRSDLRIEPLRRTDATTEPPTAEILAAIDGAAGDRLLVIADGSGVTAVPLETD